VGTARLPASRNQTGISLSTGLAVSGTAAFENAGVGISGGAGSLIQNCSAYSTISPIEVWFSDVTKKRLKERPPSNVYQCRQLFI
jgi:hypothetical protein